MLFFSLKNHGYQNHLGIFDASSSRRRFFIQGSSKTFHEDKWTIWDAIFRRRKTLFRHDFFLFPFIFNLLLPSKWHACSTYLHASVYRRPPFHRRYQSHTVYSYKVGKQIYPDAFISRIEKNLLLRDSFTQNKLLGNVIFRSRAVSFERRGRKTSNVQKLYNVYARKLYKKL